MKNDQLMPVLTLMVQHGFWNGAKFWKIKFIKTSNFK